MGDLSALGSLGMAFVVRRYRSPRSAKLKVRVPATMM